MKKIYTSLFGLFLMAAVSSCKKCHMCTFTNTDNTEITEEICGSGKAFNNQLDQYEKNGWFCKSN